MFSPMVMAVLPSVLVFLATAVIIFVEGLLAKRRENQAAASTHDAAFIPVKRPSPVLWVGLSLLFSALVLPFYFYGTRRSGAVGALLGVGALLAVAAVGGGSRVALTVADKIYGTTVAKRHLDESIEGCTAGGTQRRTIDCETAGAALMTGKLCVSRTEASDGLRLTPTVCPGDIELEVDADPARAAVIMRQACLNEDYAGKACAAALPTLTGDERAKAEAKLKDFCEPPYRRSEPVCARYFPLF